jgi:hypothetical protein
MRSTLKRHDTKPMSLDEIRRAIDGESDRRDTIPCPPPPEHLALCRPPKVRRPRAPAAAARMGRT